MKQDIRILNEISEKHSLVILVHGLEGIIYVTRIRELYKVGSNTFSKRKSELIELNLLIEKKEPEFPFRIVYELTSKGRKVAEHLKLIHEIMESES